MKAILIIIMLLVSLAAVSAEIKDCDYKIEILLNSSAYAPSDFAWKMKATKISGISTNITGAARIEDSNGKIIKTYKTWSSDTISRQKTSGEYSPNLKDGRYQIISEINVDCNDADKSNNIDSKNFTIASAANENHKDSKEEILVNPSPPLEPAPLEINSPAPIAEGEPKIKNNTGEMSLAQETAKYDNEISLLDNGQESEAAQRDPPKPELIYESSNEKSKGIVLYALLVFSVLLNIVLIWKR